MKLILNSIIPAILCLTSANGEEVTKPEVAKPPKPAEAKKTAKKAIPFVKEQVTDIHDLKKAWIINEAFAVKNGAKPLAHIPFSINFKEQKSGKVLFQTRPKVAELLRFTHATDDKKIIETIRITTLNTLSTDPMEKRQEDAVKLLADFAKKFFDSHREGKIGTVYKTKVGPYHAVALLGKLTAMDGTAFYIKIVGIIPTKSTRGIMAVMLLNPGNDDKKVINHRLNNGFAQQVLHSIRFLKKK